MDLLVLFCAIMAGLEYSGGQGQSYPGTYLGTKWCGPGHIAANFNDLGPEKAIDMCCREHDYCPDVILAGETKYNLTNTAPFSRLLCMCDRKFHVCLKDAHSAIADRVGVVYFTLSMTKCFELDYPIIGCNGYQYGLSQSCVDYKFDTTKPKEYQWFDVGHY